MIITEAKCNDCGHVFMLREGPLKRATQLKCELCGEERLIDNRNFDKDLSFEERISLVEKRAGKCHCGGHFRYNAPSRCPKCKSKNIEEYGSPMCAD